MICLPHEKAMQILKSAFGYYATETEVVAIRLPHRAGELLRVMNLFAQHSVNVSHAYNTFDRGEPLILLEPEAPWDTDTIKDILARHGVPIVDSISGDDDAPTRN
jgi:hypothetical protein